MARVAGAEPWSTPSETVGPPSATESLPCPSIARIGNDRSAPADAAAVDKRFEELLADIADMAGPCFIDFLVPPPPVPLPNAGQDWEGGTGLFEEEGFRHLIRADSHVM